MKTKALIYLYALGASCSPSVAQTLSGCAMFPPNNIWNAPVDQLPVDANSAAYVSTIGAGKGLHPDFSSTGYGIPFIVVPGTQPKVPVAFTYADESDPGPYPIPANAPIEGGASASGDRHVIVVDNTNCVLYEMFSAYPQPDGSWKAGSGAVFSLKSNQLRPAGWTSADAAGLPILPGLARYDEVAAGEIRHALRITVPQTRNTQVWPARHHASSLTGTQYPPMGQRFRLKASFGITTYPADVQVILKALKKYGAFVADNGSAWYISGAPDSRWNDTTLHSLGTVLGSNLEAVDESALMVDPNSGAVPTSLALSSVKLTPTQVTGGASSTQNQVVLSGPAPSGGVTVALSTSNAALVSIPASVSVPAGSSAAAFTIKTATVAVATPVTISAFFLGATKTATLTVAPPALSGLTVSPSSVTGGAGATGTITLTGPAPAGGVTVTVSSSNAAATAPAAVTLPAGVKSAQFSISTRTVSATTSATLTATLAGVSKTAVLTVAPASVATYSLQAPSTAAAGGTITVAWTAPAGHASNDFVGLYSSAGGYWFQQTGSATSGSFTVPVPSIPGTYFFRYVLGNVWTVAVQTPNITVQ